MLKIFEDEILLLFEWDIILRAKHSLLTCCDELDINGFLTSGQLKNLLPKIMQPGTLTKSGATITLPQFKIKQKFDLKDSLSQV